MDYSDFRRLAQQSTDIYLEYLQKHNRGVSETKVTHIKKRDHKVYLTLAGTLPPSALDSIQLQIYADRYSVEKIHPVGYRAETMLLVLHPEAELYDMISSGNCAHISVVSSLLFLVERVGKWYLNHPSPLSLPSSPPTVTPPSLQEMVGGSPSEEQYKTVCRVLSSPFSYVWGAPGTGKTRYVLSNCILSYLREDKKVLLVAPTNNALDQMLSGILEVLDESGIPRTRIRRLGIPSPAFLKKYPDVCEVRSTEERKAYLKEEINRLRSQIQFLDFASLYQELSPALAELQKAFKSAAEIYESSVFSENTILTTQSDLDSIRQRIYSLNREIDELVVWKDSFPGRLSRFFLPGSYSKKSAALEDARGTLANEQHNERMIQAHLTEFLSTNAAAKSSYEQEHLDLCARYRSLCSGSHYPAISSLASVSDEDVPAQLDGLLIRIQSKYDKFLQNNPLSESDPHILEKSLNAAELELSHLEAESDFMQKQVRVLAMTIDRYIASTLSAVVSEFVPEHIFMDEAAYCSLIKGYTLLCFGRPLTLLGDHAQLPPVCEMSDYSFHDLTLRPVFLWSQSAVYLESSFLHSYPALYEQYALNAGPDFCSLQLLPLSVTYRFGPSLARILADFIYTPNFRSAISEETSIKYIFAPSSSDDSPRTSRSECAAISRLAAQFSKDHVDFAVLSPYKKQINLLFKTVPRFFPREKIMTIHASQGREFQAVILSVVDTSKKYFVNSSIPLGKSVLNTAISRTKSELILVLDSEYWFSQDHQLIGRLLKISTPYIAD